MSERFATIEGRALARGIKSVLPIVQRWSSYPLLGCIHLRVERGTLSVTGSNLDCEITLRLDLNEAAGAWAVAVAPWALLKIAGMAGRAILRLSPDGDALHVVQDGVAEFDLTGLGASEFPWIEGDAGDQIEFFEAGRLPELLGRVASFVSTEETRYYLNGVAWQSGAFGRRFVATDGHRLGKVTYLTEAEAETTRVIPDFVVPLLRACPAPVMVRDVKRPTPMSALQFDAGDRTIRAKLIEMPEKGYPAVDAVIPATNAGEIVIGRDVLVQAATRALALNIRRYDGGHALRFEPQDGKTVIGSKHADIGAGKVQLRAAWPDGLQPFGMNGHYLKSVLATCSGDVRLLVTSNGGPIRFADIDQSMVRLLMPMRAD